MGGFRTATTQNGTGRPLAADEIVAPSTAKSPDKPAIGCAGDPTRFDDQRGHWHRPAVCEDALHFVRRGGTLLVYEFTAEKETVSIQPVDLFRRGDNDQGLGAQIDACSRALRSAKEGKIKVGGSSPTNLAFRIGRILEHAWSRKKGSRLRHSTGLSRAEARATGIKNAEG